MIKKTHIHFNHSELVQAAHPFYHLFTNDLGYPQDQICLTCRKGVPKKIQIYDGAGGLRSGLKEADYHLICDLFKNSYWEKLLNLLPFTFGRVRLMRLPPRHCMSFHVDTGYRYHIAIDTNPGAFLVAKKQEESNEFHRQEAELIHIPADGWLYQLDALQMHSAINSSLQPRVHLVINAD